MKENGSIDLLRHMVIRQDLSYSVFVNNLTISNRKMAGLTKKPNHFRSIDEVLNVLARLKNTEAENEDILTFCADLLEKVAASADDEDKSEQTLVAMFCAEQIRLVNTHKNARRYSPFLMANCMLWDRKSPGLYNKLYQSGIFMFPQRQTLRHLTSALAPKEGFNETTKKYLSMRISKLSDREKIVNLSFDEVYVAAGVQYSSGRVYGETEEKNEVAKTLFCIHISSVAGSYEDMISMTPVVHVTKEIICEQLNRCMQALTELGFKVHTITTDNHRTNQSFHNTRGDDGKHPLYSVNQYAEDLHVYPLYDTVHLFKNLYCGLLNHKELRPPPFSGEVC